MDAMLRVFGKFIVVACQDIELLAEGRIVHLIGGLPIVLGTFSIIS